MLTVDVWYKKKSKGGIWFSWSEIGFAVLNDTWIILYLACTSCLQIILFRYPFFFFSFWQALCHLWLIRPVRGASSLISNFGSNVLIQSLLKIHFHHWCQHFSVYLFKFYHPLNSSSLLSIYSILFVSFRYAVLHCLLSGFAAYMPVVLIYSMLLNAFCCRPW